VAPLFTCFSVPRAFMPFSHAICRLHQSGVVYKFSLVLITHTFKSETSMKYATLLFPFLSLQVSCVHFICCKKVHFSTHALNTEKNFICSFPDVDVRRMAVNWLRSLGSDELVDYLPQLVQALKHETWEPSPLAYFLLERALTSPRVAHHLYWLLAQALPGEFPQVQSKAYTYFYSVLVYGCPQIHFFSGAG